MNQSCTTSKDIVHLCVCVHVHTVYMCVCGLCVCVCEKCDVVQSVCSFVCVCVVVLLLFISFNNLLLKKRVTLS